MILLTNAGALTAPSGSTFGPQYSAAETGRHVNAVCRGSTRLIVLLLLLLMLLLVVVLGAGINVA